MSRRSLIASVLTLLLISGCVVSPRRGTVNNGGSSGGKLYVATAGTILRFGSALTASGNVAPEAIIATQISSPRRILIDTVNVGIQTIAYERQQIADFLHKSGPTLP